MDIEIVDAPYMNRLMEAFLKVKPIALIWRAEGKAGHLSVMVRQVVGPSSENPGRFTFMGEVKSPGFFGTLEMHYDYESKLIIRGATKFTPTPQEQAA